MYHFFWVTLYIRAEMLENVYEGWNAKDVYEGLNVKNVYEGLNAHSEVYLSKGYFCKSIRLAIFYSL